MIFETLLTEALKAGASALTKAGLAQAGGVLAKWQRVDAKRRAEAVQAAWQKAAEALPVGEVRELINHQPFQREVTIGLLDPVGGFDLQKAAAEWGDKLPQHRLALMRFFKALEAAITGDDLLGPVLLRYQELRASGKPVEGLPVTERELVQQVIVEKKITINTGGGAYVNGNVSVSGGDFVGRDKITYTSGGFERLNPGDLDPVATIPQALDNQWVTIKGLKWLLSHKKKLDDWDRSTAVLKEWRRSLVYTPQVVINRAFVFNNFTLVNDYASTENQPFFKRLLSEKIVVPYLYTEETPSEKPNFPVRENLWNTWQSIVNDTHISCVRLDWGDQQDDFVNLASKFHEFIQSMTLPDRVEHYMSVFRIPKPHKQAFRDRLLEVVHLAVDIGATGKYVTRNTLYQKFVCMDGTNPSEGIYDPDKPFSGQLKQLFDLRYNVNLPDALGRYTFTPQDSLDRLALGDISTGSMLAQLKDNQVKDLIYALRQMQFAILNSGMFIKGLETLNLKDVFEIRRTDAWLNFADAIRDLLKNPFEFSTQLDDISRQYGALNRTITEQYTRNRQASMTSMTKTVEPYMLIALAVGGSILQLALSPEDPGKIMVSTLTGPVAKGSAQILMNLKILAQGNLDYNYSLNFFRGKVNNGFDTFREIKAALEGDSNFKVEQKDLDIQGYEPNQSKDFDDFFNQM